MTADHRLAVYGSLAPGRFNHHELAGLRGDWTAGRVRGRLVTKGWGAALGYPALTLEEAGEDIAVQIFTSPDLPEHWARLDAVEGADYRRVQVEVETADGAEAAWIYIDADPAGTGSRRTGSIGQD